MQRYKRLSRQYQKLTTKNLALAKLLNIEWE